MLIDFFEEAAKYILERKQKLKKLEQEYREVADSDIKTQIVELKKEIDKKTHEIKNEILLNVDEFHYLNKYFPDLLQIMMEDDMIGKIISKKAWLLDYQNIPAQEAARRLAEIKGWRAQLKSAKIFLRKWVGKINSQALLSNYPILRTYIRKDMEKDDAVKIIIDLDEFLKKQGWLLLITDGLIEVPLKKYMARLSELKYEEAKALTGYKKVMGKGTLAETSNLRRFEEATKKRRTYETYIAQIFLANPAYTRALKLKKQNWLAKSGQKSSIEKFALNVTPHTVKEKAWLDEMKKRIENTE